MAIGLRSAELGTVILVASLGFGAAEAAGDGDGFHSSPDALSQTVRAGDSALGPVGEINARQSVQTFREASAALRRLQDRRNAAVAELAALRAARTVSDVEADIAALESADFDGEGAYIATLARLQLERLGAPSDSERMGLIAAKEDEIRGLNGRIAESGQARAMAWRNMTYGRGLSHEALAVLREKLTME